MSNFLLSGNSKNPFHLSVSPVIIRNGKVIYLHKSNGSYTLPRETIYLNESILEGLIRGSNEELGFNIEVKRYLGSLKTEFTREGESVIIEKTTLYFEVSIISSVNKKLEDDEAGDNVLESTIEEVIKKLKESKNIEYKILESFV